MAARQPDILLLQEVRAPDQILRDLLGDGWHIAHEECQIKGRAGVAVASRLPVAAVRLGLGPAAPAATGRWVEADVVLPGLGASASRRGEERASRLMVRGPVAPADPQSEERAGGLVGQGGVAFASLRGEAGGLVGQGGARLTVVSVYVYKGYLDDDGREGAKMAEKYAFMERVTARLRELSDGRLLLVGGDLNVAHKQVDVANWRGNLKSVGCLPAERAHLDRWFGDLGLVDVGRALGGDGPGPYTWWTWRGQAFDRDVGWRIDYQMASPAWAARAVKADVDRAASYDERWSDHAPVIVTYVV